MLPELHCAEPDKARVGSSVPGQTIAIHHGLPDMRPPFFHFDTKPRLRVMKFRLESHAFCTVRFGAYENVINLMLGIRKCGATRGGSRPTSAPCLHMTSDFRIPDREFHVAMGLHGQAHLPTSASAAESRWCHWRPSPWQSQKQQLRRASEFRCQHRAATSEVKAQATERDCGQRGGSCWGYQNESSCAMVGTCNCFETATNVETC